MSQLMDLISYDGQSFSAMTVNPTLDSGLEVFSLDANYIAGAQDTPHFSGIVRRARTFSWEIYFDPGVSMQTQLTTLRRLMRFDKPTERALIAQLEDGTQIQIQARPRSFVRQAQDSVGLIYVMTWEAGQSWWTSVTPTTTSVAGPAAAGGTVTRTITTLGEVRALPKVTLTPQKQKTSGVTVHTLSTLVTENSGNALTNVAWTISFDHATQVTAGNSTSAGTDIRVYVNGTEVVRRLSGTNTSSCRVCFPLTIAASGTATVNITYAGSGQTYGLGAYAQDGTQFTVTERSGNALTDYPYLLVFNHASYVTAGRSKSSGADIRVLINGTEVNRAVQNANTTTTRIWFPLAVAASATAVIDIEMSSSGYDFAGTTYTNGALDLGTSNTTFTYTTPGFTNGSDTPGILKPILAQIGTSGNPTNYQLVTGTYTDLGSNSDPGIQAEIMDTPASPADNGNYARFYWGGVVISKIRLRSPNYDNALVGGTTYYSKCRIGASSDLSTWSSVYDFDPTSFSAPGMTDYAAPAGSIAMIVGVERAYSSQKTGTSVTNRIAFTGRSTDYLSVTLDSASVPSNAAMTAPSNATGSSSIAYVFAGTLTDQLGHAITVANLTAPVSWATNTGTPAPADFGTWSSIFGATLTTGVSDPDGGTSAVTLVESAASQAHGMNDNLSSVADGTYTVEVRAKRAGRDIQIAVWENSFTNGVNCNFDLSGGTILSGPTAFGTVTNVSAAIESGGATGWWRCLLTFTLTNMPTPEFFISPINGAGSTNYLGDGTSGADLYDPEWIAGTGIAGSLVIDASTKTAWLLDVGGTEVANSATAARTACTPSGSDEDWLALDPGATSTITWTESDMDAAGMIMTVEAADRWH